MMKNSLFVEDHDGKHRGRRHRIGRESTTTPRYLQWHTLASQKANSDESNKPSDNICAPLAVAELVDGADHKAVLVLSERLSLGVAVGDLELLPGVFVALQLGRDSAHDVLLPLDALLDCVQERRERMQGT